MNFNWTEDNISTVITMLDEYFNKYGNSECIAQGDDAQMEAVELMCDISDIINPIS